MDVERSGQRWSRIRELFESACDLGPAERDSFLAEACAGDEPLRAEVEAILVSSERTPALLEAPAADAFPELFKHAPASLIGTRVGAYELVSLIASGGMGAVYLAARADDQYEQNVAIKLMRRRMLSADALRRFRTERQVLATLDHPNIARLLDGGITSDGLPYLVLEHIDGAPIDRFCEDGNLSTSERLRLFRTVCSAVRDAHHKFIVHGDLKPSNILVTAGGAPKLLDFGIAHVLDRRRAGANGDSAGGGPRILTPEYASPEQIRGESITTASDVYSLGVVLYRLLTGRSPYRSNGLWRSDVERIVCEVEPEKPSLGLPRPERGGVAGDLDAIVLAALRKDPRERYASVEQFSDDIRRHLEHWPVAARGDAWWYQGARFVRRQRAGVTAAVVVALSLLGGIVFAAWQGRQAVEARYQAERVSAFLNDMLASVNTNDATGRAGTVRAILDDATATIAAGALAGQDDVEAAVRTTIGMTYLELGLLHDARAHLAEALAIRRRDRGEEHPLVAESLDRMGRLAKAGGNYDEAEDWYRRALDMRRTLVGPESGASAETMNNLGVVLKSTGHLDEAEDLLRRAVVVRRRLVDEIDGSGGGGEVSARKSRLDVATSLTNLAAVLKNKGAGEEAATLYREALEIFRVSAGPGHYRVAVCQNNLALLLMAEERFEEAEALFREALTIRRKVFGDEHLAVATGLKNLALLLVRTGRYEEAEPLYREALDLGRRLSGNDHSLANTLNNLADLLATTGRFAEAEALCREGLAIRERRGLDHPRRAGSLLVLGRILMGRGDAAAAEPRLREALRLFESAGPAGRRKVARTRAELAECVESLGRPEEAERIRAGGGPPPGAAR